MIKKLLCFTAAIFIATLLCFNTFAADDIDYYNEDDFYYDIDSTPTDAVNQEKVQNIGGLKNYITPVPIIIGVVAGAAAVIALYFKHNSTCKAADKYTIQQQHSFAPNAKHTVTVHSNENSLER